MAPIPHVQPGDLITSELINAIIDALGQLDEKITKCCDEIDKPEEPKEPEPEPDRKEIFIKEVVPQDAVIGEMVDIRGGGFIPAAERNEVSIGNEPVTTFARVTESLIQAQVPTTLPFKKRTPAAVSVRNRNGIAEYKISVGPEKEPDVVFVPTPPAVVDEMLTLAKVDKTDIVYDLGSGDGRIVIAAARDFKVKQAVGIEVDTALIKKAQVLAKKEGVSDRVKFVKGDLFTTDFSEATVVTIHLLPDLNLKLKARFDKLKPGTRIVSHNFEIAGWKPIQYSGMNGSDVYLWVVGK